MQVFTILAFLLLLIFISDNVYAENVFSVTVAPNSSLIGCQDTAQGCYIPNEITITVGDSIMFENTDNVIHSFTSGSIDSGMSNIFDSGILSSGDSFIWSASKSGTISYFCLVYPWMSGEITVFEKIINTGDHDTETQKSIDIPDDISTEEHLVRDAIKIASFVDETKDPHSYVNRYNNEPNYKKWFDNNYSQYASIYEAVGLDEPKNTEKISEINVEQFEGNNDSKPIQKTEFETIHILATCGKGTIEQDGICVIDKSKIKSSKGGGCLIATATYGSEMATQVQQLREIRDNQLLNTESGTSFVNYFNDVYYSFSPIIADYERENPIFKEMVKLAITPMISSLSIMSYAESDSEVLSLGIGVILLNLGMYLGVPIITIIEIKRKL